ncbi:unnamed protein product [Arctogadus glacialis]
MLTSCHDDRRVAGVAMQQSPHRTCGSDQRPGGLLLFKDTASLMALSQAGGCLAEDLMNMDVAAPSAPSPGLAECKHTTTTTTTRLGCNLSGTATIPTLLVARTTLIQRSQRANPAPTHPAPDCVSKERYCLLPTVDQPS